MQIIEQAVITGTDKPVEIQKLFFNYLQELNLFALSQLKEKGKGRDVFTRQDVHFQTGQGIDKRIVFVLYWFLTKPLDCELNEEVIELDKAFCDKRHTTFLLSQLSTEMPLTNHQQGKVSFDNFAFKQLGFCPDVDLDKKYRVFKRIA